MGWRLMVIAGIPVLFIVLALASGCNRVEPVHESNPMLGLYAGSSAAMIVRDLPTISPDYTNWIQIDRTRGNVHFDEKYQFADPGWVCHPHDGGGLIVEWHQDRQP